jgi:hypothetical protein
LLPESGDVTSLLEDCFAVPTRSALLYAENLPQAFFDVSSQVAGTVLQKLRNYGVRIAVVAAPDSVPTSHRFDQLLAAEQRDRAFALFTSRADAVAWLAE